MPGLEKLPAVHDVATAVPVATADLPRLQVRAKFFFEGDRKFYLQGVTYGPFRPATAGGPNLPIPKKVEVDFGLMRELGINVVRIYHTPPRWFLDLALSYRLRVMVTVPWHKRVLFLDDRETLETIRQNVAAAAQANAGHPSMLGFFIDNEIPPDLVRWYGSRRVEEFLNSLVRIVKKHDPGALATYANFPPTEYLLPSEVDFYSYNVYLHRKRDLVNYLGRLQNLAGDKPLFLSEFGMDTIRHPEKEQAHLLAEHVTSVFESGLAGTIIFSWTDEWFTDGVDVTDWAFGIVTRDRQPKLSYKTLQPLLKNPDRPLYQRFKPETELPMVTVVVCSYNGARTLRDCLNSLQDLHYPNYEVVFVDDGSKDQTQKIITEYPRVRNIVQVNKGLSVARNVGIAAALGDVIAFTDSDCMADRDWLYFLVHSLLSGDFAAVGGPNISPPATNWIQATVGAAPGSPSHVLLTDTIAEHVPGCNMAYHKWALEGIGGFDPEYRKAGDDVDVCWRLMQHGYQIGFSPAAVVWHYRRFEVRTYFSQQLGYGEAEAMLRYKHLQYFGPTGSAIWHGNVYSQVRMDSFFTRPIIYHGMFGFGLFQCIYPKRYSPFAALLGSLEWLAVTLFVFFLSIPPLLSWLRLIPLIMFGMTLGVGLIYMAQARIEAKFDSVPARLLLLYLAIMQPWRRAWARYFTWLRGKRTPPAVIETKEDAPHLAVNWSAAGQLAFWSETGLDRSHLLAKTDQLLEEEGWKFSLDTGWTNWDLHIFASRWWNLRLLSMTEIYPHGRRLTRVGNFLNVSTFSSLVGGLLFTFSLVIMLWRPLSSLYVLAAVSFLALLWLIHGLRLRHRLAELVEVAAIRAGLQPLGKRKPGTKG
ncbi:MAG TPA: glycosyltransferase [Candidatus Methylacidiphilales bacterium]|nr:glycosyltransferase [Candidatus Methylacidiphilales bacterium]